MCIRDRLNAERGNIRDAEAGFLRTIAIAGKYNGSQSNVVGHYSFNLAAFYFRAGRYREAIEYFSKALTILKRENGDRAPLVGYALLGAAGAYEKIGDKASSKALNAAAIEILGPAIAARRPQPSWL